MLTLPPLVSNLIIDTDSDSEDDSIPETPPPPAPVLPAFVAKSHRSAAISLTPDNRAIAGSKRVYRFRETQGAHLNSKSGAEVLQSITASPALGHNSFEELRVECYSQSRFATGSSPKAVDPTMTPWRIIPPMFNALPVMPLIYGVYENDVVMEGCC